ncbi:MAG: hypothetical protein AAGE83_01400, partial [Pseudomonadota bacterium]
MEERQQADGGVGEERSRNGEPQLAPLVAIAVVAYALPRPALRLAIPAAFLSYAAVCLLPLLHTGSSYWVDWFGAVGDM